MAHQIAGIEVDVLGLVNILRPEDGDNSTLRSKETIAFFCISAEEIHRRVFELGNLFTESSEVWLQCGTVCRVLLTVRDVLAMRAGFPRRETLNSQIESFAKKQKKFAEFPAEIFHLICKYALTSDHDGVMFRDIYSTNRDVQRPRLALALLRTSKEVYHGAYPHLRIANEIQFARGGEDMVDAMAHSSIIQCTIDGCANALGPRCFSKVTLFIGDTFSKNDAVDNIRSMMANLSRIQARNGGQHSFVVEHLVIFFKNFTFSRTLTPELFAMRLASIDVERSLTLSGPGLGVYNDGSGNLTLPVCGYLSTIPKMLNMGAEPRNRIGHLEYERTNDASQKDWETQHQVEYFEILKRRLQATLNSRKQALALLATLREGGHTDDEKARVVAEIDEWNEAEKILAKIGIVKELLEDDEGDMAQDESTPNSQLISGSQLANPTDSLSVTDSAQTAMTANLSSSQTSIASVASALNDTAVQEQDSIVGAQGVGEDLDDLSGEQQDGILGKSVDLHCPHWGSDNDADVDTDTFSDGTWSFESFQPPTPRRVLATPYNIVVRCDCGAEEAALDLDGEEDEQDYFIQPLW